MSWLLFFFLFTPHSSAEDHGQIKSDAEIIVEAHHDFEVYVAPAVVKNEAPEI